MYIVLYETMYNNNIYFLLYKKLYNDNKHFLIHENVSRLIRYDVSKNVCCHYTSSCIMRNKYCRYISPLITVIYTFMYNKNICCHYISSCIIKKNTLSCIKKCSFIIYSLI